MSWWLMQATGAGLEVISALIPHWALCFQICQDTRSCCRKHPAPLMELARHQAFPIKMLRALDTESSKPPWVTSDGCLFTRAAKITTTLPLTPELDTLTSWISLHLGRMENLGITENSVYSENKNQEEGPEFDCGFVTPYLQPQRFASLLGMEKISVITKVINSGCKISRFKGNKMIRADLARHFC